MSKDIIVNVKDFKPCLLWYNEFLKLNNVYTSQEIKLKNLYMFTKFILPVLERHLAWEYNLQERVVFLFDSIDRTMRTVTAINDNTHDKLSKRIEIIFNIINKLMVYKNGDFPSSNDIMHLIYQFNDLSNMYIEDKYISMLDTNMDSILYNLAFCKDEIEWCKENEKLLRTEVLKMFYKYQCNKLCKYLIHDSLDKFDTCIYYTGYTGNTFDSHNIPLDYKRSLSDIKIESKEAIDIETLLDCLLPSVYINESFVSTKPIILIEFSNTDKVYRYALDSFIKHLQMIDVRPDTNIDNEVFVSNLLSLDIPFKDIIQEINYYFNFDINTYVRVVNNKVYLY